MRLSNYKKKNSIRFQISIYLILLAFGCVFFALNYSKKLVSTWIMSLLIIIPVILLLIFLCKGKQIFEYDGEGEVFSFKNQNIIPILYHYTESEFPKYKLISYEIVDTILFRNLYIKISSKRNSTGATLVYNISYITKRDIQDLRTSLDNAIKANKKTKTEEI